MKSILKEIAIIVLLCVAIGLILCVILYNYLPNNVTLPSNVEAYEEPNEIKNEINEEIVEYPKQNIVFEITDSDLTLYKQSQSYNPGKSDPFASSNTTSNSTQTNGTSTQTTNNNGNSNSTVSENINTENQSASTQDTKLK